MKVDPFAPCSFEQDEGERRSHFHQARRKLMNIKYFIGKNTKGNRTECLLILSGTSFIVHWSYRIARHHLLQGRFDLLIEPFLVRHLS